jgi:hypothetical protein
METFPEIGNDTQGGRTDVRPASAEAVNNREIKTEETQCITPRQTKN